MTKIEKTIAIAKTTKICPFCKTQLFYSEFNKNWVCANYKNSSFSCFGFQICWNNNFTLLNYFSFNYVVEKFGAFFNFDAHIKTMYIRIDGIKEYDYHPKPLDIKEIENLDLLELPGYLKKKVRLIKLLG